MESRGVSFSGSPKRQRPTHYSSSRQLTPQPGTRTPSRSVQVNTHYRSARVNGSPLVLRDARYNWQSWPEITLKISNVPTGITTRDLHQTLRHEGQISKIDVHPPADGRNGVAYVAFSPPPAQPFWEFQDLQLEAKDAGAAVNSTVELLPLRHDLRFGASQGYYSRMSLSASTLDFGFMYGPYSMMIMKTMLAQAKNDLTFTLDLTRKEIVIAFSMAAATLDPSVRAYGSALQRDQYKFSIPLQQLGTIWEVIPSAKLPAAPDERQLILSLAIPPRFFRKMLHVDQTHDEEGRHWNERRAWARQTVIVADREALKGEPVGLRNADPIIDIGRWTTYRITFSATTADKCVYNQINDALKNHNIEVVAADAFRTTPRDDASIWDWIDQPKNRTATSLLSDLTDDISNLSFPLRYQLEVCISQGVIHAQNVRKDFVERLAALNEREAIRMLEHVAESRKRMFDPSEIFNLNVPFGSKTRKIPSYCVNAQSATVTPSTIYFNTPTVETSNRIIREYREHGDRFLRVRFSDEKNEGRVHSADDGSNDAVYTRVYRCLKNGITIGDRHFEFLAFGNSQFREHGAYFFASTTYVKAEEIRRHMGDFQPIRSISKYAARMGQCFSTTRAINMRVRVVELEDTERNGYNFTDGVGKLSFFLAQNIAHEVGLGSSTDPPSLFQFRLGGCKGVLAVDPAVGFQEVHIRRSQYKFAAKHNGLEIIRWSSFASATLNRQLIMVLTSLGVRDEILLDKMHNTLERLNEAMENESLALKMLQTQIDFNQMSLTIASVMLDGFMRAGDPFATSILHLWRAYALKTLKEKAGLVVEKGAFLLGCTDETGILKGHFHDLQPGPNATVQDVVNSLPEIYVQVPADDGTYKAKEEICIVARNPSLHPGDIRVMRAVNVTALSHLKNVVVFPQTGDRDIPNMCSGGDLDGDDFVVIWDPDFIPEEWNHEPMNFSAPKSKEIDREVTVGDIFPFFVNYMKTDTLGAIANAHLAQADASELGVKDPKCLQLAELHSTAVDYPKSGIPATMPRQLRPRKYPHFMQSFRRSKESIYTSTNILGKLYDMVEVVDFRPFLGSPFDNRLLSAFDDIPEETLNAARAVKKEYDASLRGIMAQHEIQTEFEVWTTLVLSHSKLSKDYSFKEEIGRISSALKERFQEACYEKAGGKNFDVVSEFAVAMYKVTAQEVLETFEAVEEKEGVLNTRQRKDIPLISFPWLFQKELGKVARSTNQTTGIKVEQGPQRRFTKVGRIIDNVEHEVETAKGLTQEGDLLELFHDDEELRKPGPEDEDHIAMVENGIVGPRSPNKNTVVTLPPAENSGEWAEREGSVGVTGSSTSDSKVPSRDVSSVDAVSSEEEGEEIIVNIDDEPSALERLGLLLG